jgi:hypothetical protein
MKTTSKIILVILVACIMFSTISIGASAATLNTGGVYSVLWVNTLSVTYDISFSSSGVGYALANVYGYSGSTVYATLTLYRMYGSTAVQIGYWTCDSSTNIATFNEQFTPVNGVTYRINLYAVVSRNGVDEIITRTTSETYYA